MVSEGEDAEPIVVPPPPPVHWVPVLFLVRLQKEFFSSSHDDRFKVVASTTLAVGGFSSLEELGRLALGERPP